MRAIILAAGRGERMGELTRDTPKPLLKIGRHYLIDYAINALKRAGITEIVINISYLKETIKSALGDGKRYGVSLFYSEEEVPLETGGGIFKALPLLGRQPFLAISSDIISDYPLQNLVSRQESLAHLVMVNNPAYHAEGDFALIEGQLHLNSQAKLTYANLGIYHPELFQSCSLGHFRLSQVLIPAISKGLITGEHYTGQWFNVGTPADLEEVRNSTIDTFSNI